MQLTLSLLALVGSLGGLGRWPDRVPGPRPVCRVQDPWRAGRDT